MFFFILEESIAKQKSSHKFLDINKDINVIPDSGKKTNWIAKFFNRV